MNFNLSIKDLYKKLLEQKQVNKTFLIGIDGCGGAGKSTLAQTFKELDNGITVIHMDNFYKPSLLRIENEIGGKFDHERVKIQVLEPLSNNQNTTYQRYDWETDSLAEWHEVTSGGVVIIEGCYSLIKQLNHYYDFKIWTETPRDLRLSRGLERDGEKARYLWEDVWMPDEEQYIKSENPAQSANLIIDGTGRKNKM